jgi:hypothetical protein
MQLKELEERGWSDAATIARAGPNGNGWWTQRHPDGQWIQLPGAGCLPLARNLMEGDPHGLRKWQAVKEIATGVAAGRSVRLLCHCRSTRHYAEGCKECHCEPTAVAIEREALKLAEAASAKRLREADEAAERAEQSTRQQARRTEIESQRSARADPSATHDGMPNTTARDAARTEAGRQVRACAKRERRKRKRAEQRGKG